jgi:hypothetical protein
MSTRRYLLSLPERLLRSAAGIGAGLAREVGLVVLPASFRRTRLYQNLVDATLRFLIEQVGGVEGVYQGEERLADDFLARRAAGNVVEVLGMVAFRASPVWVLAAVADVCGAGRQLIPEITGALKEKGLLDRETEFTNMDQVLDGLERTSARLAATINAPPLDVAALRAEWSALRQEAGRIPPANLPSAEDVRALWASLRDESARQHTSIFETSSMLAISAAGKLPEGVRWLSASARLAATRTGSVLATALFDHYRQTLDELGRQGYASYAARQLGPYLRAAARQFSPGRTTLTERWLGRKAGSGPG